MVGLLGGERIRKVAHAIAPSPKANQSFAFIAVQRSKRNGRQAGFAAMAAALDFDLVAHEQSL